MNFTTVKVALWFEAIFLVNIVEDLSFKGVKFIQKLYSINT